MSRTTQPISHHRFTMLELLWAMMVLGILTTAFVGQYSMLRQMQTSFIQGNRCLIVMDNTLERLALEESITQERADQLLADEFALAEIPGKGNLRTRCEWRDERLVLAIDKPNGHPVVQVPLSP